MKVPSPLGVEWTTVGVTGAGVGVGFKVGTGFGVEEGFGVGAGFGVGPGLVDLATCGPGFLSSGSAPEVLLSPFLMTFFSACADALSLSDFAT
jgi:hypothetical protein